MKNGRIDRERLFGPVSDEVHGRLQDTLTTIREDEPVKKMKYQPLLVALLIVLLCGAAIAAVTNWDVRSALTGKDSDGNEIVNEALVQHAQPVGQVYEGAALRVEVSDAVYDGRSIAAAWTVTNKTDDLLYLSMEQAEGSINWNAGPTALSGDRMLIGAGETVNGMMDSRVVDAPQGDTVHVGFTYDVLRPAVEVVYREASDGDAEEDEADKLVVETQPWGWMNLTLDFLNVDVAEAYDALEAAGTLHYTEADAYIETGKFERVETLEVGFDLVVEEDLVRSLLPEGQPVEKVYEQFAMRISSAELSLGTLEIIVDAIYPDEETARSYTDGTNGKPQLSFVGLNEAGEIYWQDNAGWGVYIREPVPLEDGRWMMQHHITHTQMVIVPEFVTVYPRIVEMAPPGEGLSGWNLEALPGYEEGITLYLDE